MKLTKFSHSCVKIAEGDRRLVIDPGVFSEVEDALAEIDAVLITHEHTDHVDVDRLAVAAQANPALKVWGPTSVIDHLARDARFADLGQRLSAVGPGQSFIAGGLQVRTYGGQHAMVHSSVPVVSNVSYLIGDAIYHPGDSYTVPNAIVEALLVPSSAPWAKMAETYEFMISVRAPRAFQVHDALLSPTGTKVYEAHFDRIRDLYGTTVFQHLDVRESVTL